MIFYIFFSFNKTNRMLIIFFKDLHVIIYHFYNKGFRKKKYRHNKFLNAYRYDFKKIFLSLPHFKLKYKKIFKSKKKLNNDGNTEVSLLKKVIF